VAKGDQGQRIAVHVDGRAAFDLDAGIVTRGDLRRGCFLSEERQLALLQEDEPYRARQAALGALSRRELSGHDVAVRLRRAGLREPVVEETLRWLGEHGYVDDRRFASAYARERLKAGWGRQRIASELVKHGVDRELLTGDGWTGLVEGEQPQDVDALVALVRRRFRGQVGADPVGAKRRMVGFLARRGHDWETIGKVTRRVLEEAGCADEGAP